MAMIAASSFRCAYCDRSAYRHVRGDWLCKGHYQDSKGGVTMPKVTKKPVDKLTKPELLALVKRLHARITRLERSAVGLAPQRDEVHEPGPYDAVRVTQGPDTVSELVPEAKPEDWQDANKGEVNSGRMFPWEKD